MQMKCQTIFPKDELRKIQYPSEFIKQYEQ